MAIDFPTSPTPNQLHTAGSRSWTWNNSVGAWYAVNAGVQGIQGIQGTQGTQGLQGITGSQGSQGTQGTQGIQGVQGIQGITGLAFTIAKTYLSVAALNADTAPTAIVAGQFALINTTNVEDAENSRLYIWTGSTYTFVDDLSGSAGIQGITGSQGVQGIQGIQGITGTQGAIGSQGAQGTQGLQGIQGISGASILGTNNTFTGTNAFTSVTASGLISAIMTSNGTGVSVQSTAESAGGSQPSFVFKNTVGTTKSYMYCNVGAGDVALNIAGTDRLFITSTGLAVTGTGTFTTAPNSGIDIYSNPATSSAKQTTLRLWGHEGSAGRYVEVACVNGGGANINNLALSTGYAGTVTERLRIDAATGNVGIGTTNTTAKFNIGTTDTRIEFGQASATVAYMEVLNAARNANLAFASYALAHDWLTNTGSGWNSRLFITNAGNVGIGTTSPTQKLDVATGNIALGYNQTATNSLNKIFATAHAAGNAPSQLSMVLSDGSDGAVRIKNTRPGSYNCQAIHFDVHEGGVAARGDAMVINYTGNVGIGTASPGTKLEVAGTIKNTGGDIVCGPNRFIGDWQSGAGLYFDGNGGITATTQNNQHFTISSGTGKVFMCGSTTSVSVESALMQFDGASRYGFGIKCISATGSHMRFYNSSGTDNGYIYSTNSTTMVYGSASDGRLKTNIRPLNDSGSIIDAIQPHIFDWKHGETLNCHGFIAQELNEVFPEAVVAGDDDEDVIKSTWGIDPAKLVPVLVAELQSLRKRLAALESK